MNKTAAIFFYFFGGALCTAAQGADLESAARKPLHDFADGATIVTAIVAIALPFLYCSDRRHKRIALEKYLRAERETATNGRNGLRSMTHLMLKLGLTESEILQTSARSKHITRYATVDQEIQHPSEIMFGYET